MMGKFLKILSNDENFRFQNESFSRNDLGIRTLQRFSDERCGRFC